MQVYTLDTITGVQLCGPIKNCKTENSFNESSMRLSVEYIVFCVEDVKLIPT